MEKEIWKPINNYTDYEISNYGNIRCFSTKKLIKKEVFKNNHVVYLKNLEKNKYRRYCIHSLVTDHFMPIENYNKRFIVKHKDGNRLNNHIDNLEYITNSENQKNIIKEKENLPNESNQYEFDINKPIPKKIFDTEYCLIIENISLEKGVEIWQDIPEYSRYKISTYGNVFAKSLNKFVSKINKGGYYHVSLYDNQKIRKCVSIHQLVAKTFLENNDPENKTIVDHIDNDKTNNHIDNLRWVTKSENSKSYQQNFRKKRAILQYDLNDNLIRKWECIDDILQENKYNRNTLCLKIREETKYYDSIWKYETPKKHDDPVFLEEDEYFKNVGMIKGHDFSTYDVSTYGKIRNINTGHYLKPATDNKGYLKVILVDKQSKEKINITIHIVVANVFVKQKSPNQTYVNHIDENKTNNHYKNLEWLTNRQNITHTSGKPVHQIDIKTGKILKTFDSIAEIQESLNVTHGMGIIHCCQNKKKSYFGFKWQYANNEKLNKA